MECPNCAGTVQPDSRQCPHCGANLSPQRVIVGKKHEAFSLTPDDEPFKLGDEIEADVWRIDPEPAVDLRDQVDSEPSQVESEAARAKTESFSGGEQVEWGGFVRRAGALLIDGTVILLLAAVMFSLSTIGYKVGLAAHGKKIGWQNVGVLAALFLWGGIGLSAVYFVVFHGMDGRTIGKWLLGLRVVGPQRGAISFRQAFVRWLAAAGFGPIGLGFLWVLWSREKRAWHDIMARTWVIREPPRNQD
ncbi:MAG TPA: RDD family protein [Terriglobales bacterium]|nr:RDD family protein [Terriglobales bacterium]